MKGLTRLGRGMTAILLVCVGCLPIPFVRQHTRQVDEGCLFLVDAQTGAPIEDALVLRITLVTSGVVDGPGEDRRERRVDKAFLFRSGERFVLNREGGMGIALVTVLGGASSLTREHQTLNHVAFASGYRGGFLFGGSYKQGDRLECALVPLAHAEALAALDWLRRLPDRAEISSEDIERMDIAQAVEERHARLIKSPDWPIRVKLTARDHCVIEDFVREAKAELEKKQ